MSSSATTGPQGNQNSSASELDRILHQLRPRMHAARVAHVRRTLGMIALVPLLSVGAMVMASEADMLTEVETTFGVETLEQQDPGFLSGVEAAIDEAIEPGEGRTEGPATTEAPVTTTTPFDPARVLEVGVLGKVEVRPTEHSYELVSMSLTEGWEFAELETLEDGSLIIYVTNGTYVKTITLERSTGDEILVTVGDWTLPTTTTLPLSPVAAVTVWPP